MIRSFKDAATARLFADEDVPRFRGIERQARRKLLLLNGASSLNDLRSPPGNMLEALKGGRKGQHSIRINLQWRKSSVAQIFSGASALYGLKVEVKRSRFRTITERRRHGQDQET